MPMMQIFDQATALPDATASKELLPRRQASYLRAAASVLLQVCLYKFLSDHTMFDVDHTCTCLITSQKNL